MEAGAKRTGGNRMIIMTNEKPILFSTDMIQAILDERKTQTRRVCSKPDENGKLCRSIGNGVKECVWLLDKFDTPVWKPYGGSPYREVPKHELFDYSPYGKPGAELWVRETWRPIAWDCENPYYKIQYKTGHEVTIHDQLYPPENPKDRDLHIRLADELLEKGAPELDREEGGWSTDTIKEYLAWKPSIHMPRGASRIQLKINDVRVERVQDISEADAQKEGWDMSNMELTDKYDPVSMDTAKRWFADLWDRINADRGYSWQSNPWVWVVDFNVKEIKQ